MLDREIQDAAERIVNIKVKEAVAQVLGKDPRALVEAVVDAAMNQREHSYDRETILEREVNEMIRDAVQAAIQEWLQTHREVVKAAVSTRLRSAEDGLLERIGEAVLEGLQTSFYVDARLSIRDD